MCIKSVYFVSVFCKVYPAYASSKLSPRYFYLFFSEKCGHLIWRSGEWFLLVGGRTSRGHRHLIDGATTLPLDPAFSHFSFYSSQFLRRRKWQRQISNSWTVGLSGETGRLKDWQLLWQLLSIKENICAERPRISYALQDEIFFFFSLYHQKEEIHSFPAMYNTLGSSLGRNGSKPWFSIKKMPKNSFLGGHDPG